LPGTWSKSKSERPAGGVKVDLAEPRPAGDMGARGGSSASGTTRVAPRNFAEPLVDTGWWMADVGKVLVTYMDENANDESFARYVHTLAGDIDGTVEGAKRGILYVAPDPVSITAGRRKQVADVLRVRKQKLARITAGYTLVTPSPVVRGALTAIFWLAPPPYPWSVRGTAREGFAWLATHLEGLDADGLTAQYESLKLRILAGRY
jgi:hypothetical protein